MTVWFDEHKPRQSDKYGDVRFFVRQRRLMVYAKRPFLPPIAMGALHIGLMNALNFWGARPAIQFLRKLYEMWERDILLYGYRTTAEEKHGFTPKIFLGDISRRGGGPMTINAGLAHNTHQHGTQVDIYYITKSGQNEPAVVDPENARKDRNFHSELNAKLLRIILASGARQVLTQSTQLLAMEEFKKTKKVHAKAFHQDHFHVDL